MADREKVIKALDICTSKPCYCTDCPYKVNCSLDSQEAMEDALALLKEQPQIVRCKDCIFAFYKEGLVLEGYIFCTKPGTERGQAVKPDNWFCADGTS